MTAPSEAVLPVGFRYGVAFKLNSNGRPAATAVTPYHGIQFAGEKAFTLNIPDARRIPHSGRDRLLAVDQLPPIEAASGEIRVAAADLNSDAIFSNVLQYDFGEMQLLSRMTDQQGFEPQMGLLLYQQALGLDTGLRRWHFHIIPSTRVVPIPAGFGDSPEDVRYSIAPNPTTKHLWGTALVVGTEGATSHGIVEGYSALRPAICSFLGDNSTVAFAFGSGFKAAANFATTMKVVKNGVVLSSGITLSQTDVTFGTAPATNDDIVVVYELSDSQ